MVVIRSRTKWAPAFYRLCIIGVLSCFLILFFSPSALAETAEPLSLMPQLHYRLGDSPYQDDQYLWLDPSFETDAWKPYRLEQPPLINNYRDIWVRVILPAGVGSLEDPVVYASVYANSFEVFLNGRQLFTEKDSQALDLVQDDFLIDLPENWEGGVLSLRLKHAYTDPTGFLKNLKIGSRSAVYQYAASKIFDYEPTKVLEITLSVLLLFSGLVLMMAYLFMEGHQANFMSLGFAAVCMSFWVMAFDLEGWHLKLIVGSLGAQLLPVGFLSFTQRMFVTKAKRVYTIMQIILWASAGINFLLDITNILAWTVSIKCYHILLVLSIVMVVTNTLIATVRGNRKALVYLLGFAFLSLLGIVDMLAMYYIAMPWRTMALAPWAMFILILSLVLMVVRDYDKINRQIKVYAREIEVKNQNLEKAHREIAEWNTTLEKKVSERTSELAEANCELSCTMENLRTAQIQLVQSEKMAATGTLVAGLLHEINSPLGTLKSGLQLEGMLLPGLTEAAPETAQSLMSLNTTGLIAVERIISTVTDLRNFSRLDEAEVQEVDLHRCLDGTLMLLQNQLACGIRLERHYQALPRLTCYPRLLNQVFLNIMENAIEAVNRNGLIQVTTGISGDCIHILFEDNGMGISREILSKIFDPGFTTKEADTVSGLGLAIAYNIIRKHNGTIEVTSTEGEGTRVKLCIPLVSVQAS